MPQISQSRLRTSPKLEKHQAWPRCDGSIQAGPTPSVVPTSHVASRHVTLHMKGNVSHFCSLSNSIGLLCHPWYLLFIIDPCPAAQLTTVCDPVILVLSVPIPMILSTFQRFRDYRQHLLLLFIVCDVLFLFGSSNFVSQEFIPSIAMPDMAWQGYSPAQARDWYDRLDKQERVTVMFLSGIVDVLGIIPSYTLLLGSQLMITGNKYFHQRRSLLYCQQFLCYIPIWAASFDVIETLTTFVAVSSIHFDGFGWSKGPSTFQLGIASAAVQFKFACLTLAISAILLGEGMVRLFRKSPPGRSPLVDEDVHNKKTS